MFPPTKIWFTLRISLTKVVSLRSIRFFDPDNAQKLKRDFERLMVKNILSVTNQDYLPLSEVDNLLIDWKSTKINN